MKLILELEIEVDGTISQSRLSEVVLDDLPTCITSETHGDGSEYALFVKSAEVKEVE